MTNKKRHNVTVFDVFWASLSKINGFIIGHTVSAKNIPNILKELDSSAWCSGHKRLKPWFTLVQNRISKRCFWPIQPKRCLNI